LGGETVFYSSAPLIRETLEYEFREEKNFSYKGLTAQEQVEHIAKFISGLWQIHPFGEGNTRTTAVFAIKYLRTFGFRVENEPFAEHSWYFRNALVRANYNDTAKNIHATTVYLNRFFGNLLFGENHILKNRELHVDFKAPADDPIKPGQELGQELEQELGHEQQELRQELNKPSLYSEIVQSLAAEPLSRQGISTSLGQKKVSGQLNQVIKKLIADNLIERTIPENLNHPAQKLRLTERGKVFLKLLNHK
jgi:prophage maintenance system killer protein